MGLDVYMVGVDEEKSSKHPDHLFNKAYLRSSYNGSGFDRVIEQATGKGGLWYIFAGAGDLNSGEVVFGQAAQAIARQRVAEIRDLLTTQTLRLSVITESPINIYDKDGPPAVDDQMAIAITREEVAKDHGPLGDSGYHNKAGMFVLNDPLQVVALVAGRDVFGNPAIHVVTKQTDDEIQWYLDALDVIDEFIDNAEKAGEPTLIWSY